MKRSLMISLADQRLSLVEGQQILRQYPVSSARNGPGEQRNSYCTPRGRHRIRLKIGAGQPLMSVFQGRRPSGEIYTPELARAHPGRDWILTRILWLSGMENGFNRGGDCDTLRRYIYIHGTDEEHLLGQPVSHGCIRMNNKDIMELFDLTENGMPVIIQ